MSVKVQYRTRKNNLPAMRRRLAAVSGSAVEVGAFQGDHRWLAAIHEYGLDIEVTDAMRAYLHGQGLHLKKETKYIHIPERSFLRTGWDENVEDVKRKAALLLPDVASGVMPESKLYKAVGMDLASAIKDYAVELSAPPNHPFTIERKGSSNPLVGGGDGDGDNSSSLIGGITWRKA